jgi:hypothetical protein
MLAELDQRAGRLPEAGAYLREALEMSVRIGGPMRLIASSRTDGRRPTVSWSPARASASRTRRQCG